MGYRWEYGGNGGGGEEERSGSKAEKMARDKTRRHGQIRTTDKI